MEQISFDALLDDAEHLHKERKAFEAMKSVLISVLEEDNLSADSIFFREGNAAKSQYSSVYLFNDSNIFCRISFRGKQGYISVPSQNRDLIPEWAEVKSISSEPNYCRIAITSVEDISKYMELLREMLVLQIAGYPTEFGCCSRYVACSDALRCIHPDSGMAIKCAYRKNLKKGRIFYGHNKNI